MSIKTQPVAMKINGKTVGPMQVPEGMMMIDVLHEYLGLTGTRLGCGIGVCHACVVIVDHEDGRSEEMRTCITGAHFFHGKRIRTVEGHATSNAKGEPMVSPVQKAFLENFSFQCGYCTPGYVNAATVLMEKLKRQPVAIEQLEACITEALDSHLCRCTGYVRYFEAVKRLVEQTPGLLKEGK